MIFVRLRYLRCFVSESVVFVPFVRLTQLRYPYFLMAKRKQKSPSLFDGTDELEPPSGPTDEHVALHEAAQTRYLNYALSVITSRALPMSATG